MTRMPSPEKKPAQVPALIFHGMLDYHKLVLRLAILSLRKDSEEFRIFRSETFEGLWRSVDGVMSALVEKGVAESCDCDSQMRQGRSGCPSCGGCGYKVVES